MKSMKMVNKVWDAGIKYLTGAKVRELSVGRLISMANDPHLPANYENSNKNVPDVGM